MRAWLLPLMLPALLIAACGQRGPLYSPGKPGDPYYDRQNRGSAPAGNPSGTPSSGQSGNQPSSNSQPPAAPNTNRTQRKEES